MLERPIFRRLEPLKDIIKLKYWERRVVMGVTYKGPAMNLVLDTLAKAVEIRERC